VSEFTPTHEFHLTDGSVVLVAAELRGDWVAREIDDTPWYTVMGDMYPSWICCAQDERQARVVDHVIKYGHRFTVATNGKSYRYRCECGELGTWVHSDSAAAARCYDHHRDACWIYGLTEECK
jgi:hypothetical protein